MRAPLPLSLFRAVRRLLLPRTAAAEDEAEALATSRALAADARRRGRFAAWRYWRTEFSSLVRAAVTARRRDPHLPDDLLSPHRGPEMLAVLLHDVRYALRLLRQTPGFTAIALLTLALGVGANTAIFSVLNGVLLRPLPYPQSDRLYRVLHRAMNQPDALSVMTPGNFYDLQRDAQGIRPFAAVSNGSRTLTGRGEPQRLIGMDSAGSILEVLGVPPLVGRIYTEHDDQPAAERVLVLSHAAWMRIFAGDRAAVGQTLVLDGRPTTVIGVMPPDFQFPTSEVDFWCPAQMSEQMRASRTEFFLSGIGRLREGIGRREADAELQTLMAHLRTDYPQANENVALAVEPLHDALVGDMRTPLWILMASGACVLLIASANLANLMLARAARRTREMALRQAIGAARGRVVRQLLTESVVLGLLGAAAGLLAGSLLLTALLAWLPAGTPRLADVAINRTVMLFTLTIAVLSSVFFGLAPALQLSRNSTASVLRETASSTTARSRLRPALVICEVAVALVLLVGAGLLLRSFQALQQVDPGFPVDRILTFQVDLPSSTYPDGPARIAFLRNANERLGRLPGVEAVAAGSGVPLAGRGNGAWFNIIKRPLPAGQTPPGVPYRVVTPGYFDTLGIRLLSGRLLNDGDGDGPSGTPSVVVSQSVAKRFWPDGDAVGAEIYLGAPDHKLFDRATIVGVVNDVKLAGLDSGVVEALYALPSLMPFWTRYSFVVRTAGDPNAAMGAARHEIRQVDPAIPVTAIRTMSELLQGSVAPARSSMLLVTLYAAVALAMAAIGVFGVLSFNVTRRMREMGIRMALGADAGALRRLIVREGMLQTGAGIALGLVGAFWLTGFMSTLLFEVPARDPVTFAAAACVLAAAAALACYLPARRATQVDPLVVLRAE